MFCLKSTENGICVEISMSRMSTLLERSKEEMLMLLNASHELMDASCDGDLAKVMLSFLMANVYYRTYAFTCMW